MTQNRGTQVGEAQGDESEQLRMYGGPWVAAIPALVLVGILIWLSVAGRAGTSAFWAGGWLALVVGLLLVRTKRHYAEAIVRGLSDRTGIIIVAAFIFAGVFGQLMVAGGLVDGLLWFGLETGIQGRVFTLLAFFAAMVFAVGTGTSVGTVVALGPVFYPVGVFLGSDPVMVAVAILAGGAFGDNLAPISDTTIVSAYTQEADMGDVVRSRFPLAASAAAISAVVFLIFGGGGQVSDASRVGASTNPLGLFMFIAFAIVIFSAISGRPIIESLIWGSLSAMVIGILTGQMSFGTIFHIPENSDASTGVIQDGINGVTGAIIFVLFVLAVAQILIESGVMSKILAWAQQRAASTVRRTELTCVFASLLFTIPLGANAPAELLIGPSLVKPLGASFNLAPARKANLMDCAVCTIYYMLPWHNAVIVWYGVLIATAAKYEIIAPPITAAFANPYAWALLAVLLFSAFTGWNRKYATEAREAEATQRRD